MTSAEVITILAIVVLLLLSGFFSGSETALTAASKPRMHELAKRGEHRAVVVNRLRKRPERLIGGILVGNNMVNILASALATSVLIQRFGDAGVAVATILMTLLVLVFAEVLPKTYALRHPESTALSIAPVLRPVVIVLSPITLAINRLVRLVLTMAGGNRTGPGSGAREQELRGAIDLHAVTDDEAAGEGHMLRSILDLGDVDVGQIMTNRRSVTSVDVDQPAADVVQQILDCPYTRIPLTRGGGDNIIGVLHVRALLSEMRAVKGDIEKLDVARLASLPWFIPESTPLLHQLHAFRLRREHFALVVDEYGALEGVVSLEDILEEIVGEIDDEHDMPVAGVRPERDGSLVVDGTVTIRDLNRQFDWQLPDDEASTIAGLVLHEARMIPDAGQSFVFHGFLFDVLKRTGNQITSIRVRPRSVATTP